MDSGKRTQAIARSAIALANMSPLPSLNPASVTRADDALVSSWAPEAAPAVASHPLNHADTVEYDDSDMPCAHAHAAEHDSSGGIGVTLVAWFLGLTLILALTASYMSRMDRASVWDGLKAGSPAPFASEVQRLYAADVQQARSFAVEHSSKLRADALLTWRHTLLVTKALARQIETGARQAVSAGTSKLSGMAHNMQSRLHPTQQHATPLWHDAVLALARSGSGDGAAVVVAALEGGRDGAAPRPLSLLVPYSANGAADVAAELAVALGCTQSLKGRCRLVDGGDFEQSGADGAGALQSRLADQLRREPESAVILSSIHRLHPSALHVLIDLLGEHGSLDDGRGAVDTTSAVVFLLLPASEAPPVEDFRSLLHEVAARAEDGPEGTVESVMRRLAAGYLPFDVASAPRAADAAASQDADDGAAATAA